MQLIHTFTYLRKSKYGNIMSNKNKMYCVILMTNQSGMKVGETFINNTIDREIGVSHDILR